MGSGPRVQIIENEMVYRLKAGKTKVASRYQPTVYCCYRYRSCFVIYLPRLSHVRAV